MAGFPADESAIRAAAVHCEFEDLLSLVRACEVDWRMLDRIDLDIRLRESRPDRDTDRR
jgi:hypothetical protein